MTDLPYETPETIDEPEPAKSRRGLVIGVTAAVLAVVAGAAVWATTALSGGGTQPDSVVPRSTFAYVKVDLDPAAGQKLAARAFFGKFPDLKDEAADAETVFDDLLAAVVKDDDLDYERDVRPWFDRRAAVTAFPGKAESTSIVAALRSKDDGKARAALDRVVARAKADGTDVAYRITKGYVMVGQQAVVDEAVRLAAEETLAGNETYRADVDRLDGDQIAVAWADLSATVDAILDEIPFGSVLPADQAKGRLVAGLRLTNDYAELQGLGLGLDPKTLDRPTDQTQLTGLPKSTVAAISLGGAGDLLGGGEAALGLDALLGQYVPGAGLTAAGDLLPLLGDRAVVAAGPFSRFELPKIGLLTLPKDPAKAAKTAERINAILDVVGVPAQAEVKGDTFVLATSEAYATELTTGGGGLGAQPGFTTAMGDLAGVTDALWLDLGALRGLAPGFVPQGLRGLGAVSGVRGSDGFFRVRLVAG
jgi:hypothetical protein